MKPDWDKLGDAWKDSSSVLIGDVDCTSEGGQSLCSDNGVEGYPTIKYFTPETGRKGADYSGDRSFESLNSFVEDELYRECDAKTKDSCSEQEVAYIAKMQPQGKEKWAAEAKRLQGLSSGPASSDKRAWLLKRLSILEQLLGRRKRKARRMRLTTMIAIALALIGVAVLWNFVLLRRVGRGKAAEEEAAPEQSKEGAEKEAKQD
mmetsp:Transcript_15685/g.49613  ORF Transcript_15685/g.49613 Transcript_15685/m.49613 type:complete len:205 (-) Transcript_15685:65-679(-)